MRKTGLVISEEIIESRGRVLDYHVAELVHKVVLLHLWYFCRIHAY